MSAPAAASRLRNKPILSPRSSALLEKKSARAIEFLLARGTLPILYWLKKDILSVSAEREYRTLEKYAERIRILEGQGADGCWRSKKAAPCAPGAPNSQFFETISNSLRLYDFGCDAGQDAIGKAIGYVLAAQSREGLLGGECWSETSLLGHGLALEFLCRFGLDDDARVQKGFRLFLKSQSGDGGWSAPPSQQGTGAARQARKTRSRSSSLRATSIALRALAESARWRDSREARRAGDWVQDRLMKAKDSAEAASLNRWDEIFYPFRDVNILSNLDALARLNFRPDGAGVRSGLEWLVRRQNAAGYWEPRPAKASADDRLWATLAVLRVLKRFGLIFP